MTANGIGFRTQHVAQLLCGAILRYAERYLTGRLRFEIKKNHGAQVGETWQIDATQIGPNLTVGFNSVAESISVLIIYKFLN